MPGPVPPFPPVPTPPTDRHPLRVQVEGLVQRLGESKLNPVLMEMLSEMVYMDQQRAEARQMLPALLGDLEQQITKNREQEDEIATLKGKLGERTIEAVAAEIEASASTDAEPVPIGRNGKSRP